jgi:hypothetical protein
MNSPTRSRPTAPRSTTSGAGCMRPTRRAHRRRRRRDRDMAADTGRRLAGVSGSMFAAVHATTSASLK